MMQSINTALVLMITLIVTRLKRVEIQVVEGSLENTYNMFKKKSFFEKYNLLFYILLISTQIPMLYDYVYKNKKALEKYHDMRGYQP